jgi:diguanylate cyclase (GGDEF)-like protein
MSARPILVADQDPSFRSFLAGLLRARGFEVINARTDRDVWPALEERVDLAVIDSQLPDIGGVAVVTELRRRGFSKPILFMGVGWQDHENVRKLTEELGVQRVMHKPFSAYQFIVEVESALTAPASAVSSSVSPPDELPSGIEIIDPESFSDVSEISEVAERRDPPISSLPPPATAIAVVGDDHELETMIRGVSEEAVVTLLHLPDAGSVIARIAHDRIEGALFYLDPEDPDVALAEATELVCSELGKHVPVGFISRSNDVELQVAAIHAGGVVFLGAPVEPIHLRQAVAIMGEVQRDAVPTMAVVAHPAIRAELANAFRGRKVRLDLLGNAHALLGYLAAFTPDLILFDLDLAGVSGLDVCKLLRASPRWRSVAVMLLGSHSGKEATIAAFEAGADDFVVKPVDEQELLGRVRGRVQRYQAVRESAERDPLTGVLQRHAFLDRANALLAAARRSGNAIAFALLQLDMHEIAPHGPLATERALSRVGGCIAARLRAYDLRARWSGDEVILALPDVAADTARRLFERLLADVAALPPEMSGDFALRCKAGVAVFPDDSQALPALMRLARRRLERATPGAILAEG